MQYDWFGIRQVFLTGLVLGWLRWLSGSTALTILLHMLVNLEATIETVASRQWGGLVSDITAPGIRAERMIAAWRRSRRSPVAWCGSIALPTTGVPPTRCRAGCSSSAWR